MTALFKTATRTPLLIQAWQRKALKNMCPDEYRGVRLNTVPSLSKSVLTLLPRVTAFSGAVTRHKRTQFILSLQSFLRRKFFRLSKRAFLCRITKKCGKIIIALPLRSIKNILCKAKARYVLSGHQLKKCQKSLLNKKTTSHSIPDILIRYTMALYFFISTAFKRACSYHHSCCAFLFCYRGLDQALICHLSSYQA